MDSQRRQNRNYISLENNGAFNQKFKFIPHSRAPIRRTEETRIINTSSTDSDTDDDSIYVKAHQNSNSLNCENSNISIVTDDTTNSNNHYKYILISLVIILAYLGSVQFNEYHRNRNNLLTNNEQALKLLKESVNKLQKLFPNQKIETWNAFQSQIKEIINDSNKIAIIILLGHEPYTTNCLAQLLGETSSITLGSNGYLTLKSIYDENDLGNVIEWLKKKVQEKRIVVAEDLQYMSSKIVEVFHYLCDKENPLVARAVYIITLPIYNNEEIQEDHFVDDYLRYRLSGIVEEDILDPLIARIMDGPIVRILPNVNAETYVQTGACSLNKMVESIH